MNVQPSKLGVGGIVALALSERISHVADDEMTVRTAAVLARAVLQNLDWEAESDRVIDDE